MNVNYFGRKFYLFLPNVCNAKCDFCHVAPGFSQSASIPDSLLKDIRSVLNNAQYAGFDEVKITGGEPLLFSNIEDLLTDAQGSGLRYSVLTNGIRLREHEQYLRRNRPEQLMVSIHSSTQNSLAFGVDRDDTDSLIQTLNGLANDGLRVTVTSVVTSRRTEGIVDLYDRLSPNIDCKIVRATDVPSGPSVSPEIFDSVCVDVLSRTDRRREIRISDTTTTECSLIKRGFFSIQLPSFGYSACCAAINDPSRRWDPRDPHEFRKIVEEMVQPVDGQLTGAVCRTNSSHCPLALRVADGEQRQLVPSR